MEKILIYNKQFINYDQSQEMLILTITKCISINCFTLKTPCIDKPETNPFKHLLHIQFIAKFN